MISSFEFSCCLGFFCQCISSSAYYVTLQKYFSHASLVIYLYWTPPKKLKLRLQIGGRLLLTNHLDQPSWLANQTQTQGAAVRSYLLHSSLQVLGFVVPFINLSKLCKDAGPKGVSWPKPEYFNFWSSTNLNLQGHILSAGEVHLKSVHMQGSIFIHDRSWMILI